MKAYPDQAMGLQVIAQKGNEGGADIAWYRCTLKIYSLFICNSNLTGHRVFYLAIIITAEHQCESMVLLFILGHEVIIQMGTPKGICSSRCKAKGSPRRPFYILPIWLLCLLPSMKQISFTLKMKFFTYSH